MVRGPKKHLKRLNAPKKWMLDKLGGKFAPRPSPGPHKLRECIPIVVLVRNRLKYALTGQEVNAICMNRHIFVDGKVRTDKRYPCGIMDCVSIPKTNEYFRILYDQKGRFLVHRITKAESSYKLCKVVKQATGKQAIPYLTTHDGRTIRYPNPDIHVNDVVKFDIKTSTVTDFITFEAGNLALITGGQNCGRIGTIQTREKHPGSFEIIHLRDANGKEFATRVENVFCIGKGTHPLISLPRGKGLKLNLVEEKAARAKAH